MSRVPIWRKPFSPQKPSTKPYFWTMVSISGVMTSSMTVSASASLRNKNGNSTMLSSGTCDARAPVEAATA